MARPRLSKNEVSEKRARTRALLVKTAAQLVEKQGFSATSLDQVAAKAGVTKGAIYGNFASKEDLMLAVVQETGARIGSFVKPGLSLRDQMRSLGDAFLKMTDGYQRRHAVQGAEYHLYMLSEPRMAKLIEGQSRQRWDRREAELDEATIGARHRLKRGELSALAQALTVGLMFQRTVTPGLISDETVLELFEAIADVAMRKKRKVRR